MTDSLATRNPEHPLRKILEQRIAIIDGAMGTTIRTYGMKEADIRGERFRDAQKDLLNNGDLFSLTQPEMIGDIHRRFLEAGRGHHRDEHVRRDFDRPERVLCRRSARARRPQGSGVLPKDHRRSVSRQAGLGDQRGVGAAVPDVGGSRRQRDGTAEVCRRSDWAADGLAVEFAGCRRLRVSGSSPSIRSRRLINSRCGRCWRAVSTCCWWRRSSTR